MARLGFIIVLLAIGGLVAGETLVLSDADEVRLVDVGTVLVGLGAGLLLLSREPFAFGVFCSGTGGTLYVTQQFSPWGPEGWRDRLVLLSALLFCWESSCPRSRSRPTRYRR